MDFQNTRRETDVTKLMMSDFKVELDEDDMRQLMVEFHGPEDSLYEGGLWKILVTLLDDYPYKSPSVGFVNTIFHPNVEESSGSICLDVLNETWSPMFDLMNIFEIFLPQLLLYPNPSHPFNEDAAKLMIEDPTAFKAKVKEYIEMFAKIEDIAAEAEEKLSEGSDEDDSSNAKDEAARGKSKAEGAAAEADSRKSIASSSHFFL